MSNRHPYDPEPPVQCEGQLVFADAGDTIETIAEPAPPKVHDRPPRDARSSDGLVIESRARHEHEPGETSSSS